MKQGPVFYLFGSDLRLVFEQLTPLLVRGLRWTILSVCRYHLSGLLLSTVEMVTDRYTETCSVSLREPRVKR